MELFPSPQLQSPFRAQLPPRGECYTSENSMGRGREEGDEPVLGMRSATGTLSTPSPHSQESSSLAVFIARHFVLAQSLAWC